MEKFLRDGSAIQGLRLLVPVIQSKKQIDQRHLVAPVPQRLAHQRAGGQGYIAFRAESPGQYHDLHIQQHLVFPFRHTYRMIHYMLAEHFSTSPVNAQAEEGFFHTNRNPRLAKARGFVEITDALAALPRL